MPVASVTCTGLTMTDADKILARTYRRTIQEFRRNRKGWIDILVNNPGNSEAARQILTINNKLELLDALRFGIGDYEWIEDE